jgi:hypothetical protein
MIKIGTIEIEPEINMLALSEFEDAFGGASFGETIQYMMENVNSAQCWQKTIFAVLKGNDVKLTEDVVKMVNHITIIEAAEIMSKIVAALIALANEIVEVLAKREAQATVN